jgi:hypothetical protein
MYVPSEIVRVAAVIDSCTCSNGMVVITTCQGLQEC